MNDCVIASGKPANKSKYIVVTGGVISGLGKGITASSIGRLLKCSGLNVTAIKIDPYLNCDAGTMNPFFIASQYHPEFNSRPNRPSPLFRGLVKAALGKKPDL